MLLNKAYYTFKFLVPRRLQIQINRYLKELGSVGFRSPSMYHDFELLHHLDIEYDASTFDTDPFEPQPDGMGTIFPFWVPNQDRQKGYDMRFKQKKGL